MTNRICPAHGLVECAECLEQAENVGPGTVVPFGPAKAEATGDSRDWSPLEALEWLVAEIKAGRAQPHALTVEYWRLTDPDDSEGRKTHHFVASNVTAPERIVLLTIALDRAVEDWRDP